MFQALENHTQDAVESVTLSAEQQTFVDTACQELGFSTRNEFFQRAVARLAELKIAWPDSYRLLVS